MSEINEGEVLTKLTGMLNDSYMRGYQDALNTKLTEQPKLSIPKKIAEMLDYCYENEGGYEDVGYIVSNVDLLPEPDYTDYYDWLELDTSERNYNLALAYLAGKALGVELVSIEED